MVATEMTHTSTFLGGCPRSSKTVQHSEGDHGTAGGGVLYVIHSSSAASSEGGVGYFRTSVTITWCCNVPLTPTKCKESVPGGSLVDVSIVIVRVPAPVTDRVHNENRADRRGPYAMVSPAGTPDTDSRTGLRKDPAAVNVTV
jgi:hypothetical protein